MSRFQRPLPLPKSPRSSFVQRSPIILKRRPYHSWRSPCRILKSTGKCSWNFRWSLKMKSAGPAPRKGWRVGRQIALLTRSAIVSDGTRSATDRLCGDLPAPFPMSFANLPKRSCRPLATTFANYAGIKPPRQKSASCCCYSRFFVVPKRDALEVHSDCRGGEVDASLISSAGSLGRKQYCSKIREG